MKEKSLEWLRYAQIDFEAATKLLDCGQRFTGIVAYHAQQAAEKSLKAYLVLCEQDIPRTHHLSFLLRECILLDAEFFLFDYHTQMLNPFSVQTRYPEDICTDLSEQEAEKLLKFAAEILAFVSQRIEEKK